MRAEYESQLRILASYAWDREVEWAEINAWVENFDGQVFDKDEEQLYALFSLTRFMYFGKRLVREMLKSLYRDHFESPTIQRIRRNINNTRDSVVLRRLYNQELRTTRFVGVGNPAESGAHLLYFFRQINRLEKNLFVDLSGAFQPIVSRDGVLSLTPRDHTVTKYVFFDDLVGSGTQACLYLAEQLRLIRENNPKIDVSFMALFATEEGLEKLNQRHIFDGNATSLFSLDSSFRAFDVDSRYFSKPPTWFDARKFRAIAEHYGNILKPGMPLGYKNGQLLLGFSHNTPDNVPPIFWDEGGRVSWTPIFIRYDKNYGSPN